jgi:hypothetical protein
MAGEVPDEIGNYAKTVVPRDRHLQRGSIMNNENNRNKVYCARLAKLYGIAHVFPCGKGLMD